MKEEAGPGKSYGEGISPIEFLRMIPDDDAAEK